MLFGAVFDLMHKEKLTGSMIGTVSLQTRTGRYWRLTGVSLTNMVTGKVSDDFPIVR